ncbi:MAG: histidine phosphatase family protein [Candidatus Omnitrophica bacterium]|nr:histidine phosphatase family protein [Candidatus Omnitrophota bacterium]
MPTKLILIRHGETDLNLKKRYCGFLDIAINARGRKQAGKLYQRLRDEKIDKVYSSDRKRAVQTAKIIFKKRKIEILPGLREMHFGIFEGLTYKQIMKKHPMVYKKWLKDPYRITIPEGEGLPGLKKRVIASLTKVIRLNKNRTIAVVAHGGVISAFLNHILKSRDFWKHIPKSTGLSVIEFRKNKPEIKLFNDIRHLN